MLLKKASLAISTFLCLSAKAQVNDSEEIVEEAMFYFDVNPKWKDIKTRVHQDLSNSEVYNLTKVPYKNRDTCDLTKNHIRSTGPGSNTYISDATYYIEGYKIDGKPALPKGFECPIYIYVTLHLDE